MEIVETTGEEEGVQLRANNGGVTALLVSPPSLVVSLASGTNKVLGQYNFIPSANAAFPIASIATACQTARSSSATALLDMGDGFVALQAQQTMISVYLYDTCSKAAVYTQPRTNPASLTITDIAYIHPRIYYTAANDGTIYYLQPSDLTTTTQSLGSNVFSTGISNPVIQLQTIGRSLIAVAQNGHVYICNSASGCTDSGLVIDASDTILVQDYLLYTSSNVYGLSVSTNRFITITAVPGASGIPIAASDSIAIYSNGSYAIQYSFPSWTIAHTWMTAQSTSSFVVAQLSGNLLVLGENQGNSVTFRAIGMQSSSEPPVTPAGCPQIPEQQNLMSAFGLSIMLPLLLVLVLSYIWFMFSSHKTKKAIRGLKADQRSLRNLSRQSSIARDGKIRRVSELASTNTLWNESHKNQNTGSKDSLHKRVSIPEVLSPSPAVSPKKMISRDEVPRFVQSRNLREDSFLDQ